METPPLTAAQLGVHWSGSGLRQSARDRMAGDGGATWADLDPLEFERLRRLTATAGDRAGRLPGGPANLSMTR